jgi:monofunctional glycosyltransferase
MNSDNAENPGRLAAAQTWWRKFFFTLWNRNDEKTPWLRRTFVVLFVVFVCAPILTIFLYRFVPPPFTPLMMGTAIEDGVVYQHWVPLESISHNLVKAAIASEDEQFCSHHGFDWKEINQAMKHNERGGRLRGASTISQQTAKNLFLPPARNWLRKGIEAYLTVLIEALWPKRRIMEVYLNIVEWGHDRFGAEAASRFYFGKHASGLNALEATHLVAVLPNPERWRATSSGPYVSGRAESLVWRMAEVSRDRLDACVYR